MGAIASHHDFFSVFSKILPYKSDLQQLDACLLLKSIIFVPSLSPSSTCWSVCAITSAESFCFVQAVLGRRLLEF